VGFQGTGPGGLAGSSGPRWPGPMGGSAVRFAFRASSSPQAKESPLSPSLTGPTTPSVVGRKQASFANGTGQSVHPSALPRRWSRKAEPRASTATAKAHASDGTASHDRCDILTSRHVVPRSWTNPVISNGAPDGVGGLECGRSRWSLRAIPQCQQRSDPSRMRFWRGTTVLDQGRCLNLQLLSTPPALVRG
jgi:hypothetical protein